MPDSSGVPTGALAAKPTAPSPTPPRDALINPGIFEYDKKYFDCFERYKKAVRKARFLTVQEKRNWVLMGHILTSEQLQAAEKLLVEEQLKSLKIRQAMDVLKPNPPEKDD